MSSTRHAVILVAGEGKRLRPFTVSEPKCFARVGEVRILENALRGLAARGCEHARIVVGHHAERVKSVITDRYHGVAIDYVHNPDYATTNSMYSLALGLDGWTAPSWVVEGDVFFERALLPPNPPAEIAWLVDSTTRGLDGAFVEADESGVAHSLNIVRDLRLLRPRQSKSVGILHLSAAGLARLRSWLQAGVGAGRCNDYYDLIMRDHLAEGVVRTVDVAGRKWFEIDSDADLSAATEMFREEGACR